MSDALARKLMDAGSFPKKEKSHDELMVEALDKALQNTTIHKAGTPWDEDEDKGKEDDRRRAGIYIPESDD